MICSLFNVTRQGYYKHLKADAERLKLEDAVLKAVSDIRIRQPRVGTRKLLQMLKQNAGLEIGREHLFDLLRRNNMLIKSKKKYKPSKEYAKEVSPNRLKGLEINRVNQVWVTDITYLKVMDKDVYLFLVTDLFSRKILGHYVSEKQDAKSSLIAIQRAWRHVKGNPLIIHHSDHGTQFGSGIYLNELKLHGMLSSMTGPLHCYDNAVAERLNETLKYEFGLRCTFNSTSVARQAAADAVRIYNHERLHLSLGYCTPASFYKSMLSAEATQLQSA
jgi:transposase InsO family protein